MLKVLSNNQLRLRNDIKDTKELYESLLAECAEKHVIVKNYGLALCLVCDEELGWWCPDNPDTHTCEYKNGYADDECIHCGNNEERN